MKFDILTISRLASVRFPSLRPQPLRSATALAALATTVLILGTAPRAQAGHWVVTLSGSTSGFDNNFTFANNTPPANNGMYGAPAVSFTTVSQGEQVYDSPISPNEGLNQMPVQATFTWTPDNAQDTSSPPSTVTVLESGYAQAAQLDSGTGNKLMQASDGLTSSSLLDPSFFNNFQTGMPYREASVQCGGSYVTLNVTVPSGARSFTLPQRTLNMGTVAGPNDLDNNGPPSGQLTYTASVDTTPDVVITVSPTSSALGGTATTTVTVTSINGFAGTVALGLVGQLPAGPLPPLPSGGMASGGYTIVGEPTGGEGSSNGYPTAAQIAAHVQGAFSPASVTLTSGGTATATLTLTSTSAGAAGTYPIEVQGTGSYTSGGNSVSVVRDGLTTLTLQ